MKADQENTKVGIAFLHRLNNHTTLISRNKDYVGYLGNEGFQNLQTLKKQCATFPDPSRIDVAPDKGFLKVNCVLNKHFQALFRPEQFQVISERTEEQLFHHALTTDDKSTKARLLLRQFIDPGHLHAVESQLDAQLPNGVQSLGPDSQIYRELMYFCFFFEYARMKAISAHVPPAFASRELLWAMLDLDLRVENLVGVVLI